PVELSAAVYGYKSDRAIRPTDQEECAAGLAVQRVITLRSATRRAMVGQYPPAEAPVKAPPKCRPGLQLFGEHRIDRGDTGYAEIRMELLPDETAIAIDTDYLGLRVAL